MRALAVLVWVGGAAVYAVSGLLTGNFTPEQTPPPSTLHAPSKAPTQGKTLAGATLEIVKRHSYKRAILPKDTGETFYEEPAVSVRVSRPAAAHSEPTVSSPTTYRFPKGKELQVLRRQNGWIQVLDPATNFKGWVLQLYVSSPGATIAENLNSASGREQRAPTTTAAVSELDLTNGTPQRKTVKSKRAKLKERRRGRAFIDAGIERPRYASGSYGRRQYVRGQRRFLFRPFALRQYRSVY